MRERESVGFRRRRFLCMMRVSLCRRVDPKSRLPTTPHLATHTIKLLPFRIYGSRFIFIITALSMSLWDKDISPTSMPCFQIPNGSLFPSFHIDYFLKLKNKSKYDKKKIIYMTLFDKYRKNTL